MDDPKLKSLSMECPAIYRVCVCGELSPRWNDGLESFNLTEKAGEDGRRDTILVGRLSDQVALSGLLNTLYELHLPLLSVECLRAEDC